MINYLNSIYKILNHPLNKDNRFKAFSRIVWWKTNQLFFHYPSFVQLTPETKCICYPDSSFGGLVVYTKYPEYDEMSFVYSFLQADDTFCDVGANIGAFSLIASSKIKSGKIFAFEPSAKALEYLEENIRLNGLDNKIKVVTKVVSDKAGYEYFSVGKFSEVDHITTNDNSEGKNIRIASITLDGFLTDLKVYNIDLVKIDVEGAELKVLKGLKQYLSKGRVGVVIFELNSRSLKFGNTHLATAQFLENYGYKLYKFCGQNKVTKLSNEDLKNKETSNVLAVHNSHKLRVKRLLSI